jgi:hypothetical protein
VFTSNIFAILGLRSLFFMLAGVVDRFRYLKAGLALVLVFVGIKMLIMDVYKVPPGVSLLGIILDDPRRVDRRVTRCGAAHTPPSRAVNLHACRAGSGPLCRRWCRG